jgi:hypothetical protein
MNLVGITNENEFYTNHYLSEIFEKDTSDQISSWQEKENQDENYKTPFKKLRGIGPSYLELLKELNKKNSKIEDKIKAQRDFMKLFLDIFDYEYKQQSIEIDDFSVQLLSSVSKSDGLPYLYIVESFCEEECDILTTTLKKEQLKELDIFNAELNFDSIITSHIFTQNFPPRWVMVVNAYQIVLIERAKWAQKRYLRFDIKDILERKEDNTLKALSILLHKDTIAPTDGLSLLDTLDENSHKHAFGVTEDLKYSLRSAVELLGNEALYYHQKNSSDFLNTPNLESDLTRESLRYMYRLLFLFYIESRPELGFIPSKSPAFIKGYSLETLRDLELMPLLTDSDKNGYFFDESIRLYFDMIFNGRESHRVNLTGKELFSIAPLKSHLFDPAKTPLLNGVKLRNHIWQEIIQSLSLSREQKGNRARGRISYANLGINQLGAVYEALLSYKGFIAKEDLFEVKKADSNPTELENAYFVNESQLSEYHENERVFNSDGTIRRYPIGTFIYRLAGRDREKSASYYTPEVLTKSLVKYALKELLEIDEQGKIGKKADEILNLTVCEPAMGSAAFLNEAINQLSEAYLHQKQIESGNKIAHDKYTEELQRVKMYIADNNVYGIDLNPTAVELAEISLWLNAMFTWEEDKPNARTKDEKIRKTFIPWFGFQLENGNSLIGARREVYDIATLNATKKELLWYSDAPKRLRPKTLWRTEKREITLAQSTRSLFDDPTKLPLVTVEEKEETKSAGREKTREVYHFLLGDEGMSNYSDKVVKELKKDEIDIINKWRKEFIKPYNKEEIKLLLELSLAIDKLWQEHTRHINDMKKKTTDPLKVWGQPKADQFKQTDISYKDRVFEQEKLTQNIKSSSPYIRLKTVMNYWCSLWFWPIDEANNLPTRSEFLRDVAVLVQKQDGMVMNLDKELFSDTIDDDIRATQLSILGVLDVEEFIAKNPRLQVVERVSNAQKFLHWELEFADIFAKNGGFDMVLGNPPWLKVKWKEGGIMGEANPLFDIRQFSSSKLNSLRNQTFETYKNLESEYIREYISSEGTQSYLNSLSNFPLLKGVQTNLYKCFLPVSWKLSNKKGMSGFIHEENVYDDAKGGLLRKVIYEKLLYHFQFQNEKKLFQEVGNQKRYSINIYMNNKSNDYFINIANLFLPQTIDMSFNHNETNIVDGIKDINNNWNVKGHKSRLIKVDKNALKLFANLYDEEGTPYNQARLPALHSIELLSVLTKLSKHEKRLFNNKNYSSTIMYDETYAQRDGFIQRNTSFVDDPSNFVLSGPHFYMANSLYQTPKRICNTHKAYDAIDLENIDNDYISRSNYIPKESSKGLKVPTVKFDNDKKITDYYRMVHRSMLNPGQERTFIASLVPKGFRNINTAVTTAFKEENELLSFFSTVISLPVDFFVKSTGKPKADGSLVSLLPIVDNIHALIRALSLSCLTKYFDEFWNNNFLENYKEENWSKLNDSRLNQNFFKNLTSTWQKDVALRSDYERRQALVEIDVLVAQELGLTLEELKTIYRIQFSILQKNESETFYDISGRIVFSVNSNQFTLPRKANKKDYPCKIIINGETVEEKPLGWEDIIEMQEGEIHRTIIDDTTPDGPMERTIIYKAPFAKCDREKDYEIAWKYFERLNNE